MRTNSGSGESTNNNHDPTLRDRDPVTEARRKMNNRDGGGPSDSREPRK